MIARVLMRHGLFKAQASLVLDGPRKWLIIFGQRFPA
jgi:hypothetical protein